MKEFTGTKGKWGVWLGNSTYKVADTLFRDVLNIEELNNIDEAEANAQIMAAAPEMLETLMKCKSVLQDNLKAWQYKNEAAMLEAYKQIEDTITKALGV